MTQLCAILVIFSWYTIQVEPHEGRQLLSLENCPDGMTNQRAGNRQPLQILASSLAPTIVIKWNSTGHVTDLNGFAPYILNHVAEQIGLPYCWIPLGGDRPFDDLLGKKGLITMLSEGVGDLIVGAVLPTRERFKLIEFAVPMVEAPFSIMIPFPEKTINQNALYQPFQAVVWICLGITIVVVVLLLYFFNVASNLLKKRSSLEPVNKHSTKIELHDAMTYVVTVLLNQGNSYANQQATSRLIAGAWCLAALVLVSAYSGTLLSFMMSPVRRPVVDSIYDIPNVPGLKVALDRGRAADVRMELAGRDKSTNFGRLMTSLHKTMFRCNQSMECIDKLLSGNFVYIHGRLAINQMIDDDLAKFGKCRFTEAKKSLLNSYHTWGLPKNRPLNHDINKAILQLDANGFSTFWKAKFAKIVKKCVEPENSFGSDRLTFAQLYGIFVLLGVGNAIGLLVFVIEKLTHYVKRRWLFGLLTK